MNYQTLDEAYAANEAIRAKLRETITALSEEQLDARPDGEKWSIKQIVEHVAMVSGGAVRICSRLLSKAEEAARPANGFGMSAGFLESAMGSAEAKLEAPETVHPVAGASIEESLSKLDDSIRGMAALREKFEKFDCSEPKFPHPYFGDLTAQEWFVLSGAHEGRHLRQIRRILEKIG
jgi:hypothetical protein